MTMRPFRVYDSLSREIRPFEPLRPPRVGLFVCGLTPYAEAHIGHGRTVVTFDVVARALRRWGYHVFSVQNVTNLDDKLIAQGALEGRHPLELAAQHFASWERALDLLRVRSVNLFPFATDYIPEIIEQVEQLLRRGFAYAVGGDVYYEVAKFPNYGRLSGQRREAQQPGTRVETDPKKRAPEDFALWKSAKPGEPSWPSPWGPGRPGWHIEDTAITVRLLGDQYDLHGGGMELKFPHHEAEIAQAEAATGKSPLVRYWMHAGLLNMRGEKMSKSLGNVFPLDAAIQRFSAGVVRFFYLNAVYRSPLEFVEGKSLEESREAYDRLSAPYRRLTEALAQGGLVRPGRELPVELEQTAVRLPEELDGLLAEDFNTREAIARLFVWGRSLADWLPKLEALSGSALVTLGTPYRWAVEVLGLFEEPALRKGAGPLEGAVKTALAARRRARGRGDFAEADRIRDELREAGFIIEDQGEQTRWSIAPSGGR